MSAKEGYGRDLKDDQLPEGEESPADKLAGDPPPGSQTPGAENPESEEIKGEINPNTE